MAPTYMQARYNNWVEGLTATGWFLASAFSAFRFRSGTRQCRWRSRLRLHRSFPAKTRSLLTLSEPPAGYDEDQRGKPGGFVGDPDVMDTWATSSLPRSPAAGNGTPTLWSGSSRWIFARRLTRSSAPGCFQPSCAHGRQRPALETCRHQRLDPRPTKKMSKSRATSVTPADHSSVWHRRRSLLGSFRSSRDRYRLRRRTDEDRAAARHQDPQR